MSHLDAMSMGSRYPWWWRYGDHVEAENGRRVHTLPLPHTVEGSMRQWQSMDTSVIFSLHMVGRQLPRKEAVASCHTIGNERSRELWGLNSH
jgi:hypothetical protein